MGLAKREMEEQQYLDALARKIALEAGVIKECEYHVDTYIEDSMDVESAYKLANFKITEGQLAGIDRRKLTDAIKRVVETEVSEECYHCRKWDDD